MSQLRLLRAVMGGVWLMDQKSGEAYMPAVIQLLTGQKVTAFYDDDHKPEPATAFAVSPAAPKGRIKTVFDPNHTLPEGSIAIIPVQGPLMKEDFCGEPGTATLATWIEAANNHASIAGILLLVDSPGGHVDGTQRFANAVAASVKPVVALIDGMMASASYWIGSASHYIMASSDTDLIGSIGTRITLGDYKEYYQKHGVKVHDITADLSADKIKMVTEAFEGNYKPIKEDMLNPMNDIFLAAVKANRGEKLQLAENNEPLTGKVYLAQKAISVGLIDGMGDMATALDKVMELSTTANFSTTTIKMNLFGQKFKALSAIAAKQRSGEAVTDADLAAVNAELQAEGVTTLVVVDAQAQKAATDASTASAAIVAATVRAMQPEATDEDIAESAADLPAAVGDLVSQLAAANAEATKLGAVVPPIQKVKSTAKGAETTTQKDDEFYSEADAAVDELINTINGRK